MICSEIVLLSALARAHLSVDQQFRAGVVMEILWEIWKQFGDLITLAALALIWIGIKRERKRLHVLLDKLPEKVDTLGQHVKAAQDAIEKGSPGSTIAAGDANIQNWEEIRSTWRNIRERLELAIEQIRRKSTREKYGRFDRYSYSKVIKTLSDDQEITDTIAADLLKMNAKFLSLRRRTSATSQNDLQEFKNCFARVDRALPKLPEGDAPDALAAE